MSFLDRNIFNPPYRGVPFAVAATLVLYFLLDPSMPIFTGQLADPDDYMRLVQVMNWLQGQGWYDTSQPNLNPDNPAVIPWSRLVDMPIAGCMLAVQWLSGLAGGHPTLQTLALWASYIVPPLYLLPLVWLTAAAARPLLGRGRARLAPLLLVLFWGIVFNVTPGRVDHHIHALLVAMVGLYAVPRVLLCAGGWRAALWCGGAFAAGLQICTEIVPFLLLCWAVVGMGAAWRGNYALRNAAIFTGSTAVMTAVLIPVTLPIQSWSHMTISRFSPAFLVLTGVVALGFGGAWFYGRCVPVFVARRAWTGFLYRGGALSGLGMVALMVFLVLVPSALQGPYADYDHFTATRLIANISETRAIWDDLTIIPYNDLSRLKAISVAVERIVPLAVIAVYGWVMACLSSSRRRWVWLLLSAAVTAFLLYSVVGMIRTQRFADTAAVLILAHAVFVVWRCGAAARRPVWEQVLGATGVLLLVMVVPHVAAKTLARSITFPVVADGRSMQCDRQELLRVLMQNAAAPQMLMAPYDEAPEILFYTPHKVIGANYNVGSNRDVYNFFNARDDDTAIALLRRYGVDRVLLCRNFPPFLADREKIVFGENSFLVAEADGTLRIRSNPERPALIDRLARGDVPSWLTPIPVPNSPDYLLFAVGGGDCW